MIRHLEAPGPADPLTAWCGRAQEVWQLLCRPDLALRDLLEAMPAATPGAEDERLTAVASLLHALGAAGGDDPPGRAGRALAERGRSYAGGVEAAATQLLRRLAGERLRLLKGGGHDPQHPVLLASDFGTGLYEREGTYFGETSSLPSNHWA